MSATREALDWLRSRDRDGHPSGIGFERDPERALAMMRQRAIQLAAPPVDRIRTKASSDFLVVQHGATRFALALATLREIAPLAATAAVPGAAVAIRGVMPWRGAFVTVFDLGTMLGLDARDGAPGYAVILRSDALPAALAVDSVERVARIDPAEMPASDGQRGGDELVRGMTSDGIAVLEERQVTLRMKRELRDA